MGIRGKTWTGRAARSPPALEGRLPKEATPGRAALKGPGLILPEDNGVRACPALGAFFVRIALGQPAGIPLPPAVPQGTAAAGRRAWAAPAGEGIVSGLGAGDRAAFMDAGDTT